MGGSSSRDDPSRRYGSSPYGRGGQRDGLPYRAPSHEYDYPVRGDNYSDYSPRPGNYIRSYPPQTPSREAATSAPRRRFDRTYSKIADNYSSLEEVHFSSLSLSLSLIVNYDSMLLSEPFPLYLITFLWEYLSLSIYVSMLPTLSLSVINMLLRYSLSIVLSSTVVGHTLSLYLTIFDVSMLPSFSHTRINSQSPCICPPFQSHSALSISLPCSLSSLIFSILPRFPLSPLSSHPPISRTLSVYLSVSSPSCASPSLFSLIPSTYLTHPISLSVRQFTPVLLSLSLR